MKKRLNALIILVLFMTLMVGIIMFMLPRIAGQVSQNAITPERKINQLK